MHYLPKDSILEFHSDTFEMVRKINCVQSSCEMQDLINILDEWVKKQRHFTKTDFSKYFNYTITISQGYYKKTRQVNDMAIVVFTLCRALE